MIAIVDIDGVLADASHRQHHVEGRPKDWDAFFAEVGGDAPIHRGVARLREVAAEFDVILLSGRPESTRADTLRWLDEQGISVVRLVLRPDGDYRRAAELKADLIRGIGTVDEVGLVIDDDPSITERLAAMGYSTELFR